MYKIAMWRRYMIGIVRYCISARNRIRIIHRAYCKDKHLLLSVLDGPSLQSVGSHDSIRLVLPGHKIF